MSELQNARRQMKTIARNELHKIWNAKLAAAGYEARYIVEAEEVTVEEETVEEETAVAETVEDDALVVYEEIQALDYEQGTENYLPLYFLRDKLEGWSRDRVNKAVMYLESEDMISTSTLQEGDEYTREQQNAGIPQAVGGPIFFLIVE